MDTQINRCSFPRIPVVCAGIELLTIWEVRALADYQVGGEGARRDSHVRIAKGGQNFIALRTHAGRGVLAFADGGILEVDVNSLVLFDFRALECHRTLGGAWDFWWFEFRPLEPVRLPIGTVIPIPLLEREVPHCHEIFESLRSEKLADRCAANAGLQALMHRWWAESGDDAAAESHHASAVRGLIDAMHRQPERSWTLPKMAVDAGMSVSSLRGAFHETTGTSPSALRNRLRLAHAYERLRVGTRTVGEVAAELGFCDPFHFSKAFKREFGFPPSRINGPPP